MPWQGRSQCTTEGISNEIMVSGGGGVSGVSPAVLKGTEHTYMYTMKFGVYAHPPCAVHSFQIGGEGGGYSEFVQIIPSTASTCPYTTFV